MSRPCLWLCALTLLLPGLLFGQGEPVRQPEPAQPQVVFTFERAVPGVLVPRYTILIQGDGTGEYHAEMPVAQSAEMQRVDRKLIFAPATVKSAMDAVQMLRASGVPCASKQKNVADTGTKTLAYRDGEGEGSCTYNYSENKGAVQLTTLFQGIEFTLEEGRALDFKHRFDRLGLDAEMSNLADAVEAGRALALENIAATLRSIAGDTELIQRVRLRAAKLLDGVKAGG